MKNMKLTPMTEEEYLVWSPRSMQAYAADKMKANGLTKNEAETIAADDFNRLLPQGIHSKDNFLYAAKDEDLSTLGFIWFCVRGAEGNRRAFICDVIIEEPFRGKGYGRQMMLLLEQEVKRQGLNRIGLHVFGFNKAAISLYQSLGYATTDLVLEKSL